MTRDRAATRRARVLLDSPGAPAAVGALLMAGVALWSVRRPSLWADELATDGAAGLSWRQLALLVRHVDLVIAPYYALMHVWTRIAGDGEGALRLPSVVAMVVAAALTADTARRLWGRPAAWVCAVLFAAIPSVSRYGQEARPYALSVAAIALATWLVVRSAERDGGRLDDLLSAAALCLAGLLQPLSLLAAPGLFVLRGRLPSTLRRWTLLAVLATLPGLLLLVVGLTHQSRAWSWIAVAPWTSSPYRAGTVLGPPEAAGALFALAAAGIRARRTELGLAVLGLLPVLVLVLAGTLQPVFVGRLLMFTTTAIALLGSFALTSLGRAATVAALVVVVALGLPYQATIRGPAGHGQDSRAIASIIGPRFRAGDVAVYGDLPHSIPWTPRDIVRYYLPPSRTPEDVLALHGQRVDGRFLALLCTDLPRCLGTPARIWVIRVDTPVDPTSRLPDGLGPYLRADYRTVQTFRRARLTVALLELRRT